MNVPGGLVIETLFFLCRLHRFDFWLGNQAGFPCGATGLKKKKIACQCRRLKRCGFDPWFEKIPCRRKWQLSPVFLPGKSHGQRSLAGYSPWGCKESDTIEVT